jgi:hypothetical protein
MVVAAMPLLVAKAVILAAVWLETAARWRWGAALTAEGRHRMSGHRLYSRISEADSDTTGIDIEADAAVIGIPASGISFPYRTISGKWSYRNNQCILTILCHIFII